jgi:hypothetical protein
MANVRVTCSTPRCGALYNIDESDLGAQMDCQRCERRFVLSHWAVGEVVLGDYEIEGLLGAGGWAPCSWSAAGLRPCTLP